MNNGYEVFARGLATSDENQQAAFLNAFAEALRSVCAQGHGWNTQCCYIGKHLHEGAREMFDALVDYAELAVEERRKCSLESQQLHRQIDELQQRKAYVEKELEKLEAYYQRHPAYGITEAK